jgi:hypothetical protein
MLQDAGVSSTLMLLPPALDDSFVYILLVSGLANQRRDAALSDSGLHPAGISPPRFFSSTAPACPSRNSLAAIVPRSTL